MDLPVRLEGYRRYTFVDGVFDPALSEAGASPASTIVIPANSGRQQIEVIVMGDTESSPRAPLPSLQLKIEPRAQVSLIERHLSRGNGANAMQSAIEIDVGANSEVRHYRVQQTGTGTDLQDSLTATVAAHAAYGLCCINLGGQTAHSNLNLTLAGERAQVAFHTVSLADRNQRHETFSTIQHVAANTSTVENFRGIANGDSRVTFNGKIVVRDTARGTNSRQSLRGLIATAGAQINVQPFLEIYTDEVQCSHGATAGKLDDNMLFYLLSRGLERDTAQQLLKWAFLEDVVSKIDVPELRRQIEVVLASQMSDAQALKELV